MDKFNQLWPVQLNIYDDIKFVDSKALAITAINGAVLGGQNSLTVLDSEKAAWLHPVLLWLKCKQDKPSSLAP